MKNLFKRSNSREITDERIGPLLGEALGSLPENGECPLPEDIAALSENKIAGEERERLLLHLADCDRCRAAYSMVCEMIPVEEPAANTDFKWQARRLVPLAAAAGLILVIVSWPFLTHREVGINETVSPYIQKPAAIEPEKPATPAPKAGGTSQVTKEETKVITPEPEAQIPPKKGMVIAPPPKTQAVPNPVTKAVSPAVPMPAKEIESADATSKSMEAPKQAEGFEPHIIAAPITKAAEPPTETVNHHKLVEIDKEQRLSLSKADSTTSDKNKIEGIFNDLKLDTCGFPLQDINKVVVQWVKVPRYRKQAAVTESRGQDNAHADISLEEGGVLKIVVQENILRRPPAINAVGC